MFVPPPSGEAPASPETCHVLLVEDDDGMRMLVTRALRESGYRVTGSKAWITHGGVADFYNLFARTGEGSQGISCFLVPGDTPGLTFGKPEEKMGLHAVPTTTAHYDDAFLDADRRKDIILHDARDLAFARGLELVEDEGLLEEVAGLVEWPVVLMGEFEEAFLAIPAEMIQLTIRTNQKCFVTRRRGQDGVAQAESCP